MQNEDREQGEWDLAHLNGWVITKKPNIGTQAIKAERVNDGNHDLTDAIAVEVLGTPIVASGIKEANHFG